MSEYAADASDQKLFGAPPGYVGYEAGGQLTNAVRANPFSVLLFDEVEKAHPSIMDKFLQILEDGRMTDGQGQTVYFGETLIFFTSNVGISEELLDEHGAPPPPQHRAARRALRRHLRPGPAGHGHALQARGLERIGDNIVVFDYISPEASRLILESQIRKINGNVRNRCGITVAAAQATLDLLAERALAPEVRENGGPRHRQPGGGCVPEPAVHLHLRRKRGSWRSRRSRRQRRRCHVPQGRWGGPEPLMAASPNISREPRRDVAPTIVDAAPTLVDIDSTAPVLSGADLPFQGDGDRTFTLHTADVIGAGGQGTVVAATDEEGRTFVAKIAYQPHAVRDRLARRAVLGYLRRLMAEHPLGEEHFRETHLMPLYATGQISDEVPGSASPPTMWSSCPCATTPSPATAPPSKSCATGSFHRPPARLRTCTTRALCTET